MDVPDALVSITKSSGVHSTHISNPETAEQLASKTRQLSTKWGPVADRLFDAMDESEKKRFRILKALYRSGGLIKNN
jgi:UTP:GlnB (protein PII) uridylyltransferase